MLYYRASQTFLFCDLILTLKLANTQHFLQNYCAVGRQFLSWSNLGETRKHCGMWHVTPSIKRIQQSSITHSQSKMQL